ncbi:MAG: aldehyde ferredoxin oxidoreductase family protein [Candidatus Bathyarchaeia archaeon]
MLYGYNGRVLKIDLADGNISTEKPPESFYRTYFGGRALIAYYLLKETEAGVDPFSPENLLIFATGVITGHSFSGSGRNSVGAKSPLTGAYGDAEAGGFWGAELKKAGYDAIVVRGKAEKPTYVWIHDGEVELRDASHLWGRATGEVEGLIKKELEDTGVRVAQIGPAGERLVRYACVVNDLTHFAGRTGMGAVMGSKKLRAIAMRGKKSLEVANPERIMEIVKWIRENFDSIELPIGRRLKVFHDTGTSGVLLGLDASGGLPTRNFKQGSFERAEDISGETMRDTILVGRHTCYACAVACKRTVKTEGPYMVDSKYGGPEYETLAALGSNCGIGDLKAIAKANEICAAYGVDTISAGASIAFAMECFENGILTDEDTGGVQLRFGNAKAMLQVLETIVKREGLGKVLGEGVKRAAEKIGRGSRRYALHVKGLEVPMHEPRLKKGLGVGYAVGPTGADHCHNLHDTLFASDGTQLKEINALGFLSPLPAADLSPAKIRLLVYVSNWRHFINCAVTCYFLPYYHQTMADIVNAVTGWNTTVWELMKVGERAATMARAFNVREGFNAEDDYLPERFSVPFKDGLIAGEAISKRALEGAKRIYYGMMGWDPETGVPTHEKLHELGIGWVAEEIHR